MKKIALFTVLGIVHSLFTLLILAAGLPYEVIFPLGFLTIFTLVFIFVITNMKWHKIVIFSSLMTLISFALTIAYIYIRIEIVKESLKAEDMPMSPGSGLLVFVYFYTEAILICTITVSAILGIIINIIRAKIGTK